MTTSSRVAAEQLLMARFMGEPDIERDVRADPERAAREHGVTPLFVAKLLAIDARRVAAFRASANHKNAVRLGKPPSRVDH